MATKTVKAGKRGATVKGLAPGKKAWVQVQPLRKAGGKTYGGAFTRAKSAVKVAGKTSLKTQSAETQPTGDGKLTATALWRRGRANPYRWNRITFERGRSFGGAPPFGGKFSRQLSSSSGALLCAALAHSARLGLCVDWGHSPNHREQSPINTSYSF